MKSYSEQIPDQTQLSALDTRVVALEEQINGLAIQSIQHAKSTSTLRKAVAVLYLGAVVLIIAGALHHPKVLSLLF